MTSPPILSPVILWCWGLAALAFGLLALDRLRSPAGPARRAFAVALALTALWALAMAGMEGSELATRLAEGLRTLAWLGFMATLARHGGGGADGDGSVRRAEARARVAAGAVYGVVAAVVVANLVLAVVQAAIVVPALARTLGEGRLILRMMAAVSALVLTHHLHAATARGRQGGPGLVVAILAMMWSLDLAGYAAAWWLGDWPPALLALRGAATLLLAPALAVAAHRGGEWTLHLSRTVAWQSLRAVAAIGGVAALLLATALVGTLAGAHARVAQTAFVLGSATALLTLLANPWLRAWTRVKIAKHLFRHRYDYRAEWVRFTDTLGQAEGRAPLDRRIVKAVADLVDSPAGLLLVPDGDGLGVGAAWNWGEAEAGGAPLAHHLAASGRIVEIDPVRAGQGERDDAAALPGWMLAHEEAWAVVPLLHLGRLAGAILLARPPVERALDWEDLDLLRICGRQAASYLAEARAQDALAEARRFDEFSRRFAFIVHDVKNLASQIGLVARNAERHADNPDFRADMVATLRESADRMNALLARLSQHGLAQQAGRAEPPRPVPLLDVAERVARRRRTQHPVTAEGDGAACALADAGRLERLVDHLVQNAIEASAAEAPVTLVVRSEGGDAVIEVVDRGCGMAPGFVRDELFRPFHSSKPGGFGIGAFEARQLAEAMGGGVSVDSREGEGTRFAVRLPAARAMEAAA